MKIPSRRPIATSVVETWVFIKQYHVVVEDYLTRRSRPQFAIVRADHRVMLRTFLETGSYTLAAKECGVGPERVRQLMCAAMRHLRSIGKAPALRDLPTKRRERGTDAGVH